MGCVSSRLLKKNVKQEVLFESRELPNHVVSLTSSTYGALKLDLTQKQTQTQTQIVSSPCTYQTDKKNDDDDQVQKKKDDNGSKAEDFESKDALEVINTWELMEDLEEETAVPSSNQSNWKGIRSPFKRLVNHVSSFSSPSPSPSPKEGNQNRNGAKLVGKENKSNTNSVGRPQQCFTTPRSKSKSKSGVLKFSSNSTNNRVRKAASESESPRKSDSSSSTRRRRSLGPLFDPELIESLEKELYLENNNKEQIKKVVKVMVPPASAVAPHNSYDDDDSEKDKCPAGGENCVVMYTTTLRGIRKTFEECNAVRSAIEAYHVRVIERDISMDSGFKEELRKLMMMMSKAKQKQQQVRVPVVFVKGRLIGGAEEVLRLDEEGKLEALLQGVPKAASSLACQGCGGMRFVMCMDCNGSCKVLVLDPTNNTRTMVVRCGECNENGLIQCPLCC